MTSGNAREGSSLPGRSTCLTATLTATTPSLTGQEHPQPVQSSPLLGQVRVRVNGHGHLQRTVLHDAADEVRRDAEAEQQRHAGMPKIMESDVQTEPLADGVEVPVQVPGLDLGSPPGGEDKACLLPVVRPARSTIGEKSTGHHPPLRIARASLREPITRGTGRGAIGVSPHSSSTRRRFAPSGGIGLS